MEVNELLNSIDIVDYIGQFVELTEKNGEWWGLSPFKEEKTPSFSVRRETNRFFDFSSGIGGSLITFVKRFFHLNSGEAIKKLADYAGVDGDSFKNVGSLAATDVCKRFLTPKSTVKSINHTVLADDYMQRYEKRADKLEKWEQEGISDASLDKFEVYYDSFSDRLVYPIRDTAGKIVNIGGRTLDPMWKEKKLRKYTYFFGWGGGLDLIYGLSNNMKAVKNAHEIILFEGCKSVLLADTWGIHNTGALLTSHLSACQLKILARLGCRVVFALDKDINIREDHNIARLKQYVNVSYIQDIWGILKDKDSPVDEGKDNFLWLYEQRFKYK